MVSGGFGRIALGRVSAAGAGPHELHRVPVECSVPDGFEFASANGTELSIHYLLRAGVAYLQAEQSVLDSDGPDAFLADAVLLIHAEEFGGDQSVQFRL